MVSVRTKVTTHFYFTVSLIKTLYLSSPFRVDPPNYISCPQGTHQDHKPEFQSVRSFSTFRTKSPITLLRNVYDDSL